MPDIERIDQAELIGQDSEAIGLIARAVLQIHIDWDDDSQWIELGTNPNPRGAQLPKLAPPMLSAALTASLATQKRACEDVIGQENEFREYSRSTTSTAKKHRPSSAGPEGPILTSSKNAANLLQQRVVSPSISTMCALPPRANQLSAGELPTRRALF